MKAIKVKSTVKTGELDLKDNKMLLAEIKSRFGNSNTSVYIIAHLVNEVLIGKYENSTLVFFDNKEIEPKYLLNLRVFSENKELYIWKNNDKFKFRMRTDETGDGTDVIETDIILWGTDSEPLNDNFTRIFEDRGIELILPGDFQIDKSNRKKIKVRFYIGKNEIGLAEYVDARFVNLV